MNQEDLIRLNLQPLRVDSMPADVATEYLTSPGIIISGAFRRTCIRARESYYVSTISCKPIEVKLARKFSAWSIRRLARHSKRIALRIRAATRGVRRIGTDSIKSQAFDEIILPLLDVERALRAELERRRLNIQCQG